MSMVRIGPMCVSMGSRVVPVRMAVLSTDRRIVRVVVVPVVMRMGMLVFEFIVGVFVLMALGEMEVERRSEKTRRNERR